MVPPRRSMPSLNPLNPTGSVRYACTTRMVAITVGMRQMTVLLKKGLRSQAVRRRPKGLKSRFNQPAMPIKKSRIVPLVWVGPASLAGRIHAGAASGGPSGLDFTGRLVAREDLGDRTLEDADPRVRRLVDLERHLVLVFLHRNDDPEDAAGG